MPKNKLQMQTYSRHEIDLQCILRLQFDLLESVQNVKYQIEAKFKGRRYVWERKWFASQQTCHLEAHGL